VKRLICLLLVAMTVMACGRIPTPGLGFLTNVRPSDPLPYDANLSADGDETEFRVAVESRGAGLEAVRETVRFYGTRHCLTTFGSSAIVWGAQPGAPEAWIGTRAQNGRTVYSGRCLGR